MNPILIVIIYGLCLLTSIESFTICDVLPWSGVECKKISDCNQSIGITSFVTCGFTGNSLKICCPPEKPAKVVEKKDTSKSWNSTSCGNILWERALTPDGKPTSLGEFPWLALLEYKTLIGPKFRCGGVLISDRYILTAAHCLHPALQLTSVRLGEHDLKTAPDCANDGPEVYCADDVVVAGIEKQIPHEDYEFSAWPNNFEVKPHDIALLRLDRNVYSDFIKPICLPDKEITNSKRFLAAGWGVMPESFYLRNYVKNMARYNKIDKKSCQDKYKRALDDTVFCAIPKSKSITCIGDSGGPLMTIDNRNKMMVVGLYLTTNLSSFCLNTGNPETYLEVIKYTDWIKSHMQN